MAYTTYRKLGLEWCKKDEIRPSHSILLVTKLVNIPIGVISHALTRYLSGLVSVFFRDDEEQDVTFLLCDLDRPASLIGLGSEIRLDISGLIFSCRIVRLDESLGSSKIERMRICDITDSDREWSQSNPTSSDLSGSNLRSSSAQAIPSAQPLSSDLSEIFSRSTFAASYRKLKCFSGLFSPARDEDDYTSWIDHVEGQMDEWQDLDDAQKRRRIREALRSPALNIVNDLRRDNPAASSLDYLKALDVAFGDTETDDELFVKLHSLSQTAGESPSKFLTRLQNCLRKVLRRGVVPQAQANKVRLNQFIRGILFDEMILVNLHLRDKVDQPPSFLTLLSLVRKQEDEAKVQTGESWSAITGPT